MLYNTLRLRAAAATVLVGGLAASIHANTVNKASSGTDLKATASWGGTLPTSNDTAAFVGGSPGSLGAGLTIGSTGTVWGAISDNGAQSDVGISGSLFTLSGNQTLDGFTNSGLYIASTGVNLSIANNVALGASQTWDVGDTRTATFTGTVSGTGFSLTKASSGTLILGSTASYSGGTTISGGTLQVGVGASGGTLSTSGAIVDNGTLVFNKNSAIVQGTGFSSAAISGTGNLIQAGSNTLSLNAANTFTGTTTINIGGTLGLTGTAGALSVSSVITTNGTLAFTRTNLVTQGVDFTATAIGGTGGISVGGGGTLTLNSANTYAGGTALAAGNIRINNEAAIGAGALIFNQGSNTSFDNSSGAPITLVNNNAVTLANGSPTFVGTNSLNFGTGTLTLSTAANPLIANATRTLTVNGSTLTFNGIVTGVDSTGGNAIGLNKAGAGTLELNGQGNFSGAGTISGGTLRANNSTKSLGTGTTTVTSTGVLAGGSTTSTGATGGSVVVGAGTGSAGTSGKITAGTGATSSDTIGSLATGGQTWNKDGTFVFKFLSSDGATSTNTGTGSAGTNWDLLKMGTLTISQGFTITLSKALAGSFNGGTPGNYLFATTTGLTIPTGFRTGDHITSLFTFNAASTAALGIDSSNFQVDVGSDGTSLYLNYNGVSPVPEPTVVMMSGLGGAALFVRRSRRTGFSALRWLAALRAA